MRHLRFVIALGLALTASNYAFAVCNAGANCENPAANGSAGSWTASASGMTGIQNLNSGGPSGNDAGSRYYFAGVTSNLGATTAKGSITTTGDGTQVIGSFALNSGSTPGSTVTGGVVNSLLGGEAYFFYVQACPSGALLDSARCSVWVQIGTKATLDYPTSAFSAPVAPTDADTDSINLRTSVPTADIGNISQIQLTIDNMLGGTDQAGILLAWAGNATYTIDNSLYTSGGGFDPNTKYQYIGKVYYPYGVAVPTAGGTQIRGPFWTTPVNPSNVVVSNITHCSAQITSRNTGGATGNPNYTVYQLCANPTGAGSNLCDSDPIGGTGAPTDTTTQTLTNLNPGSTYTPQAQALVGNGDGSQGSWNSSSIISGTNFTTDGTNGVFTISNVTTTTADFNFPAGFDVTGAVSWQRMIDGSVTGPVVAGLPPTTITFSGLTPNTQYSVQIKVNEASCSYIVPPSALTLTTTPNVPQTFNLTAVGPRELSASWAANGNPGTTVYQLEYCLDAGFTSGCRTTLSAAGATSIASITTGVVPETTYFAHVRANTVGGGSNSAYSNSDSATTPNEDPNVVTASCSAPAGSPSASVCTGTATDNGPTSQLRCTWTAVSPGGQSVTFTPSTAQTPTGSPTATCPDVTATFTGNGTYTLTLHVQDADGSGLEGTKNVSVVVGPQPFTVTVTGGSSQVATGGSSANYTATVLDQFGNNITGSTVVNWATTGAGNSMVPATGTQSSFHAGLTLGTFNVTASAGSVTSAPTPINVVAAGPHFTSGPTLTVNVADYETGTLTAAGTDNVLGTAGLTYTWSLVSGPAPINVSPNGTTSSDNATVTFSKAGQYVVSCVLTNANGSSAPSNTGPATVPQVLSSIGITPNNVTISLANRQMFALQWRDQFGVGMPTGAVIWDATGGSVSAGVFQTSTLGNNIRITATATQPNQLGRTIQGAATVNVVDYDVSAAKAYPVPFKSTQSSAITFTGLGSDAHIRIYSTSGRLVFSHHATSGTFPWTVVNSAGEKVASGVYLYVIESPTTTKHGKLIIIQ